jgi:hypothetical protein
LLSTFVDHRSSLALAKEVATPPGCRPMAP